MRMGEVEIISMLMPALARVWNMVAVTPGWVRIPAPDERDGGDVIVGNDRDGAELRDSCSATSGCPRGRCGAR